MFVVFFALWMGGVILASFMALQQTGASIGGSLFLILIAAGLAFLLVIAINQTFLHLLKPYPAFQGGFLTSWELRRRNRMANRRSFWGTAFTLLMIFFIGYLLIAGIPYLLLGVTIGELLHNFFQTEIGQLLTVQLLAVLPIWFILPFIYLFAFYGPFFLKVIFFDVKTIPPGSAQFSVRREDIRGQDEVLEELIKMMQHVADRANLIKKGKIPARGALLIGPPGTGKTHTLRFLSSAFGFALVQVQSTISRQTFIGVSVLAMALVRWLAMRQARKYGGAVVLIDEVDLIAHRRSEVAPQQGGASLLNKFADHVPAFGGADDSAIVVLMTWMDGMEQLPPLWYRLFTGTINTLIDALMIDEFIFLPAVNFLVIVPLNKILRKNIPFWKEPLRFPPGKALGDDGIFFIGTTNRPQVLDPAMTRDGRFSVKLYYDLPNEAERLDYIDYLLKQYGHAPELDQPEERRMIALLTEGLAQANIRQIIRTAWLNKLTELKKINPQAGYDHSELNLLDIIDARDTITHGIGKTTHKFLAEELRRTAYHEAGHFLITKAVARDTLIPHHLSARRRGGSLGRVESLPLNPVDARTQRFFDERLRIALASHAAERAFFGENTIGVAGDLGVSTLLACQMVELFGMGPRKCTDEERARFQKVGKALLARGRVAAATLATQCHIEYSPLIAKIFGDEAYLNPAFAARFIDLTFNDLHKEEEVAVILGQAYTFCDLFFRQERNIQATRFVAQKLEQSDWEIRGAKLQELYQALEIQTVSPPREERDWPNMELDDPFYQGGEA